MPLLQINVTLGLKLAAAFFGAAAALFIFALLAWTARDIAARTNDFALRAVAVLAVLLFNVLGLVMYMLLRPPETAAERRERELVEAILTREAGGG